MFDLHTNFSHDDIVKREDIELGIWSLYSKIELNEEDIKTYMTVFSDWIDHDRQYQLNKSW